MVNRTVKSSVSPFSREPSAHRRVRVEWGLIAAFIYHGMGDWLYYVGAWVIRSSRNMRRTFKRWFAVFARAFLRVTRRVLGAVSDKLLEIFTDIAAPFKKLFRSVRSLFIVIRSSEDRGLAFTLSRIGMFFKYGWLWNKQMILRFANYLLPLVSLAVCLIVVNAMRSLNYVLEINYNGQTVGYVQDEGVYDSARKIIENRMVASENKSWTDAATMSIAVTDEENILTQDVMAEQLLAVSGEEIVQATGLYVGGTFLGATTAGELLSESLASVLAPAQAQAVAMGGDVSVKFARNVVTEDGVYPADSVLPFDTLNDYIINDEPRDIYYVASGGEKIYDVATENGISTDRIYELNPTASETLSEGDRILVASGEQMFRDKTIRLVTKTETIGFETRPVKDARYPVGFLTTVTVGENGVRTIVSEVEYVNGEAVNETVISNEITKEPIPQEIIVGSRRDDGDSATTGTGGLLTWPTASPYSISRGYTAGGHLGVDIAADSGTTIFAADSGVVTVSGWTDTGYGNYVVIDHQNGMQTVYGHNSANLVSVGDVVSRGQPIALVGTTGNSTGNHLHFETRVNGERVDPYIYLYG